MLKFGLLPLFVWTQSKPLRLTLGLILSVAIVACGALGITVHVKTLGGATYPPKPQTATIDEWLVKPSRPYVKFAKIFATTETDDEESVWTHIMEKAKTLGADGVIKGSVHMSEHMASPRFQSTLTPEVQYSVFSGGPGSGLPMFYNPWAYAQTSADGITWTMYMSAYAIHYIQNKQ